MNLLLRRKRRCVAITRGIGFQQHPSFSEESIDLLFSIMGPRPGIPRADNLNFLIIGEVKLFFLDKFSLRTHFII